MKKLTVILVLAMALGACGKLGVGGTLAQAAGNWAEVRLPAGCVPKQVAAEEGSGVVVLCEDGRVFH